MERNLKTLIFRYVFQISLSQSSRAKSRATIAMTRVSTFWTRSSGSEAPVSSQRTLNVSAQSLNPRANCLYALHGLFLSYRVRSTRSVATAENQGFKNETRKHLQVGYWQVLCQDLLQLIIVLATTLILFSCFLANEERSHCCSTNSFVTSSNFSDNLRILASGPFSSPSAKVTQLLENVYF